MTNILLIDDDEKFKEAFQIETQRKGFKLIYKKSFEGLQEIMPKLNHKIIAVVLDIKCLITDDQKKEDEGFIGTATKYLDVHYPRFPRIILTGDDDAFENYRRFTSGEDVFQKTPDGFLEVFKKLQYYVTNSEILKIKRNNLVVFELFEKGLFDAQTEKTLVNILTNIDERDNSKFGGIFRDTRAMQETIYKVINTKDKNVVPDNMIRANGMIRFNALMKHLNGYPDNNYRPTRTVYQNSSIFNLANSLYWVCGGNIHANPGNPHNVNNYTIRTMVNSLMELFIWSEKYIT